MGQLHTSYTHDSNDELTNTMIRRRRIRTINVEKVFRCVDRGLYINNNEKPNAYRDSALQSDNIHLSAPCIYATVLECLEIMPGNKFLNIGSGIGYFSTMAGLLLGSNGVNHGIEIHQSLVDNAYEKMEEFKLCAAAIDYYEFCEPVFIQGNVCELSPLGYYDRVYCGASVPPEESDFMKSLINIGGILVMPLDGILLKITRKDENLWQTIEILEVSFTDLVIPEKCNFNTVKFPIYEPMSLLEQSRSSIRSYLRNNLQKKFPDLHIKTKCQKKSYAIIKNMAHDDPLSQFIHIQYGLNDEGIVNLRNLFDSFADLSDGVSESDSMSDNNTNEENEEVNEEENEGENEENEEEIKEENEEENEEDNKESNKEDNKEDNNEYNKEDNNEYNKEDNNEDVEKSLDAKIAYIQKLNEQTEESIKRKSQEASCSEQNNTPTEGDNPKRIKIESVSLSSENNENVSSSSSSSSSLSSSSSSASFNTSELWNSGSSSDTSESYSDINEELRMLSDSNNDDNSSEEDTVGARELIMYRYISDQRINELSILLKVQINSLNIPVPLKRFLNYNRAD